MKRKLMKKKWTRWWKEEEIKKKWKEIIDMSTVQNRVPNYTHHLSKRWLLIRNINKFIMWNVHILVNDKKRKIAENLKKKIKIN